MVTAEIHKDDQKRLNRLFKELAKGGKKTLKEVFMSEVRLFAVEAAAYTARTGRKAFVAKNHKADITSTWKSTYISRKVIASDVSKQYGFRTGTRFYNYMGRREYGKAQELLDALGFRTSKGNWKVVCMKYDNGGKVWLRINARNKGRGGKKHPGVIYCLSVMKQVNADIREQKKLVGSIKKGWWEVAKKLGGTRGIPAYVGKAAVSKKGFSREQSTDAGYTLEIENRSDRASRFFDWSNVWKRRGDIIEKKLKLEEERRLKRILDRANRKK